MQLLLQKSKVDGLRGLIPTEITLGTHRNRFIDLDIKITTAAARFINLLLKTYSQLRSSVILPS